MASFILFILAAVVLYAFVAYFRSRSKQIDGSDEGRKLLSTNIEWIEKRWARALQARDQEDATEFQSWYFDDHTKEQKKFLKDLGITRYPKNLTKGQVSDLIGLFHEPENVEMLKFFKVTMRGMTQAKERDVIGRIMKDPEKVERWNNRPPVTMQKEYYRFFELPIPKKVTKTQIQNLIDEHYEELSESDQEDWDAFESNFDDLNDPELRRDEEIKAVSLKFYRNYMNDKRAAGARLADIDAYDIAEELKDIHPELER